LENENQLRRFCEGRMIKEFSAEKRRVLKSDLQDMDLQQRLDNCLNERCLINLS
jgi:hypothetical protein